MNDGIIDWPSVIPEKATCIQIAAKRNRPSKF